MLRQISVKWNSLLLLFLANFLMPSISMAQVGKHYLDVHPVRVNHKWGYVKIYPSFVDTIISPIYDFLGDNNMPYNTIKNDGSASPYKIFDLDGKVGLLNPTLKEVVPNQYQQIKVVSDDYFAVTENKRFWLRSSTGTIHFDRTQFENICLAEGGIIGNSSYFYTKKNGQWGISRIPNDAEIVASIYEFLKPAGLSGYHKVKVKNNTYWGLIDTTGQLLLPTEFEDILVLDEQTYAVLQATKWFIYNKNGDELVKKEGSYEYLKKINQYLSLLVSNYNKKSANVYIWNFKRDSIIHTFRKVKKRPRETLEDNYRHFCNPLDNQYAIKFSKSGYHLINSVGKKVSPNFRKIKPTTEPNIYLASQQRIFGLFHKIVDRDTFISSGFRYNDIFRIKDKLAICRQKDRYGVIGITQDSFPLLPCNYTAIPQIYNDSILLQFNDKVFNYIYKDSGVFLPNPIIYEKTILVPEAPERILREAMPIEFNRYDPYKPEEVDYQIKGDSIVTKVIVRGVLGRPVRNPRTGKLETKWKSILRVDTLKRIHIPKKSEQVLTNLNSVYIGKNIPLPSSYLSSILGEKAKSFQLYDNKNSQSIKVPKMIGLRRFNLTSPVSAFIAPSGKMGIINKAGRELTQDGQPIHYTYIGPFIAGRARVCSGGRLTIDTDKELPLPPKFNLGNVNQFLTDFSIIPNETLEDEVANAKYFVKNLPNDSIRWSYIDTTGKVVFETNFDYVEDFHWRDKAALVLKEIDKEVYKGKGKNDAVYGIIDLDGNLKVKPIYSRIGINKDFYVVQKRGTPTFTFNQAGHEIIINPTKPQGFSEGRAQIKSPEGLTGYINPKGEMIIPPQYKFARNFSDGRALIIDTVNNYQFISEDGQAVFGITCKNPLLISDFKEGYTWIKKEGKNWFWKCVNIKGEVAFKRSAYYQISNIKTSTTDNYFVPMSFSNGLTSVVIIDMLTRKLVSAIIDTSGQLLHQFKQQLVISPFNQDGKAIFEDTGGKGVLDSLGKIWIRPIYKTIKPFQKGLWKIQTKSGLWGLIDDKGNRIIPPKYFKIDDLSEDIVALKINDYTGWSYANKTGNILIKGPFRSASPFRENHATITKGETEYIINKAGETINFTPHKTLFFSEGLFGIEELETQNPTTRQYYADDAGANVFGRFFQAITPFQQGIARVKRLEGENKKKELFGAINKRGVMIVAPKFKNLHIQQDGNIIINPQRYFGILNKQGKELIKPQFDKIEQFSEFNIFRLERGESVGYVQIKNGKCTWVWGLQK